MVRTVYLLFEILSIIVCLFWLFGQKIKITRGIIGLIIIHPEETTVSSCTIRNRVRRLYCPETVTVSSI